MIDQEFVDFQLALAGEYSLERELGRGGMGIVYLARDVQLDRPVAIKVLPGALAARRDVRERFLREARMAASLSDPHIVPIHRVGEGGGFVFFVMAFVKGETLGERLRTKGPLSPAAAARLLREVAWALSYAHGRGIVHRDIKPDNILIESETGRALVTDFGIAQQGDDVHETDPGRVMGTAHFMSPEQAASEPIDGRSDLYSLGVVGYLALSGRLPFDAPNVPALLIKQVSSEAPSLASVSPSTPNGLVGVIHRCLHKRPDERYATGEELAEAIDAATAARHTRIPVALRVWAQAQDPLKPLYIVWSGGFTLGMLSELAQVIAGVRRGRTEFGLLVALALAPLAATALFHARKSYQAFAAGYTLRDVRAALAEWQRERREELTFDSEKAEPRWARTLRWSTWALMSGAGFSFLTLTLEPFMLMATGRVGKAILATMMVGGALSLTVSNILGVRLVKRGVRPKLIGAVRSAIWNSKAGEWLAKLLTPARTKIQGDVAYRPTEMALGLALDDLYRALPSAYRDDLAGLPSVVRSLEAHAAAARARIEELDALAALGSPHAATHAPEAAVAARDAAKKDLAEAVSALEAIRLDLLRLHAGASDLQPITMVLESARELGVQLDRLRNAKR
jgi:serine/threonine-protein kinase